MVKMYESDVKRFPKFRQFVQYDIPQVPHRKPHVYKHFLRFSEMSDAEGKRALSWGKYPLLKVKAQDPFGEFDPNQGSGKRRGNLIYFAERLASAFEQAHTLKNSQHEGCPYGKLVPKGPVGEAKLLAEAIILHEIVHWGDYHEDYALDSIEDGNFMSREMGISFEQAAYGKSTHRPAAFQKLREFYPALWD